MFNVAEFSNPQAAVDAAQSAGGGVVYFPPGEHNPVTISQLGVTLLGSGLASRIVAPVGQVAISVTGTESAKVRYGAIRNLRLAGEGNGLHLAHCTDYEVSGCHLLDLVGLGISIEYSWTLDILASFVKGCGAGIEIGEGAQALAFSGCRVQGNQGVGFGGRMVSVCITGCTVEGNKGHAIHANSTTQGLTVMGCHFEKNNYVVPGPQIHSTTNGNGYVIAGNFFHGSDDATYGILIEDGCNGLIAGNGMQHHTVRGIEVRCPAAGWIVLQSGGSATPNPVWVEPGAGTYIDSDGAWLLPTLSTGAIQATGLTVAANMPRLTFDIEEPNNPREFTLVKRNGALRLKAYMDRAPAKNDDIVLLTATGSVGAETVREALRLKNATGVATFLNGIGIGNSEIISVAGQIVRRIPVYDAPNGNVRLGYLKLYNE